MILYVYIAPGQGQTTPWGQTFDVNRKPVLLCQFIAGLKKKCFEVRFYIHCFHVSPYVYSPGQGQTVHWGQNFDDNRKAFSLCQYVAKFFLNSDFIHICNVCFFSHMYIAPGRGQTTLWDKILMSTESPCHLAHLLQVSKKCL